MRKAIKTLSVCLGLLLWSTASAAALPLTWHFVDVHFEDGGTVTGSFVYDADLNAFSNIDVSTSAGTLRDAQDYGVPTGVGTSFFFDTIDQFPIVPGVTPRLLVTLTGHMSTDGGTIPIDILSQFSYEGVCSVPDCGIVRDARRIEFGSISTVPEPASLLLVGAGLATLASLRRARRG